MKVTHSDVHMADVAAAVVPTFYLKQGDSRHSLSSMKGQSKHPSDSHGQAWQRTKPSYHMLKSGVLLVLCTMLSLYMHYSAKLPLSYYLSGTTCHPEKQVDGL